MEFETVSPEDFGRALKGIGLNLLVRDVKALAAFLTEVFGMSAHRLSADFAIMTYAGEVFQLHSDATYHSKARSRWMCVGWGLRRSASRTQQSSPSTIAQAPASMSETSGR